jgi:hypothetical protein
LAPGNDQEAAMAEDRKAAKDAPLSEEELRRLQALANKRGEALDVMGNAIRKQQESQRGIIDKMR